MKSVILKNRELLPSLLLRSLKWHLNYFLRRGPLPLACGLYITSRCNFKCNFCNIWRKRETLTLPFSKAKKIVDDLSSLGCFYFSITGGEPLLVNYLFDLLNHARRSRIRYLHLVTNGYLIDRENAIRLRDTGIDEISISIDGSEKFHDEKRGVSDAYSKAVGAIENLKRYAPKITIVLNAVFYPQMPFESLHIAELARQFEVFAKVQPLNQHPVFDEDNHSRVSYDDISQPDIKEVIESLQKEETVVNSNAFLDNVYNFFCQKEDLIFRDSPCLFGYHHIEILEDGRVFPCLEGLNWRYGIESPRGLKETIFSKEYKKILEGLKTCKGCLKNYYICYYEPRINFPINNFLRFAWRK